MLGELEMTTLRSRSAAASTNAKVRGAVRAKTPAAKRAKSSPVLKQSAGLRATAKPERRTHRSPAGDPRLLAEEELVEIEQSNPDGLTVAQVIDAFHNRGLHLSEATFRKYVQLGLLGRSRRVGRKGKHQGSRGMYPATTVRRVNTIKQMMAASYTIEDIQRTFLRFTDDIEGVQRSIGQLLDGFDRELAKASLPGERKKVLSRELSAMRKLAAELVQRVESLERQLVSPLERAARERAFGTGAKGGADELL